MASLPSFHSERSSASFSIGSCDPLLSLNAWREEETEPHPSHPYKTWRMSWPPPWYISITILGLICFLVTVLLISAQGTPIIIQLHFITCFGDILVPSEFYYSESRWTPRYAYPNDVAWDDKIPKLYWRGKTPGGQISGSNYRSFPRFRAVDMARAHPELMDVEFSGFHNYLCGKNCDGNAIMAEYGHHRHLFPARRDLDGNSFSGRYFGLLRSGSLVFKASDLVSFSNSYIEYPRFQTSIFSEYFNDWLRPFEHYIPVLPDLSDLAQKVEWAIEHDAEARAIQEAGQVIAERVLTDVQNDCYFSAVLLEWARLQSWAEAMQTP
ncbi:hypothetical protein DFH07DRAFT_763846 [Mycena maculata]|uniref:Glycosyl transferase CAP10 domain-containing protein n=1 Tax=Mycena maculata TaxID=230809 RepID=A0AAD7P2T8_9AGAR|nr:hypothetical protein DFH07DRAFT_763846 [Mycena maculata]